MAGPEGNPAQTMLCQRLNSTFIFRCISFSMFSLHAAAHKQKALWDRTNTKTSKGLP